MPDGEADHGRQDDRTESQPDCWKEVGVHEVYAVYRSPHCRLTVCADAAIGNEAFVGADSPGGPVHLSCEGQIQRFSPGRLPRIAPASTFEVGKPTRRCSVPARVARASAASVC